MQHAEPAPSDPADAPRAAGRKLVFVVTEDWFFASHFLPMARAARELGLTVRVVCRVRDHGPAIEATGKPMTIHVSLSNDLPSVRPAKSLPGTGHFYVTKKNARTMTEKMTVKKYDPKVRKHVEFKEGKIK